MKFPSQLLFVLSGLLVGLSVGQNLTEEFYKDCNSLKGCVGFPKGCLESKNCSYAVNYVGISSTQYQFETLTKQGDLSKYLAMGLSMSGLMVDSSVVACSGNSTQPQVAMYWNLDGDSLPLKDASLGLSDTSLFYEDGFMVCKFTRDAKIEFETPGSKPKNVTIDINSESYAVVMAYGEVDSLGHITYHYGRGNSDKLELFKYNPFLNHYFGCGKTKGCFGNPQGCVEAENCQQLVSYKGLSADDYQFEVYANVSGEVVPWIGVGLTPIKGMANASVVICSIFKDQSRIQMYWNVPGDSRPLSNPSNGISDFSVKEEESILFCSFKRKSETAVTSPYDESVHFFDLNSNPYYILMANGPLGDDGIIKEHTRKILSDEAIRLSEFSPFSNNTMYQGCGKEKGCFGTPQGCDETQSCTLLVTYQGLSADKYKFEIYGKLNDAKNPWIGAGLSSNQDLKDTSLTACSVFNNNPQVQMYFANSGVFRPLENTSYGISDFEVRLKATSIECSFVRNSVTEISNPQDGATQKFDLNSSPYYLVVSSGPLNENGLIEQSTVQAGSSEPISFSDYNPYKDNSVYDGCGKTKGCFGTPQDCVADQSCDFVATYRPTSTGDISFNFSGFAASNSYLALGLANENDMFSASVMFCYLNDKGEPGIAMSINTPEGETRDSVTLEDPVMGLSGIESKFLDGLLSCGFIRQKNLTIPVPNHPESTLIFDLSQLYYLLIARGPMDSGSGTKLAQHDATLISTSKQNLSEFGIPDSTGPTLARWHGSLMSLAWIFFATAGTMTARYGRAIPGKVMGKDIWFRIHQGCMGTTWLLSVLSIIVILCDRGVEPLAISRVKENPHAAIGLTSFLLAFIQPFMAYFRPHPGTKNRPIFNYSHLGVGISAIIFAWTAIGLSTRFDVFESSDGRYLMGAFAAFYLFFHIILTVHNRTLPPNGITIQAFLATFALGALACSIVLVVFVSGN